ncbi:MAG: aminopeptidase [Oscillospiraceae bacterium]|nr:aminopeptidase [Oscillospiraceae bacterium]
MNKEKALRGAKIVIENWMCLKENDRLLIVTDSGHKEEAELLKKVAEQSGSKAELLLTQTKGKLVGVYFDANPDAFADYDYIIGATDYSLVTTLAAKNAIREGKKFLSLPLHTNDGRSMLEYDFMQCDTDRSRKLAQTVIQRLHNAQVIHVTTKLGTDIYFYKKERHAKFFNGKVHDCDGYSSASIEVYVPIQEDKTHGTVVLDGSYGYIGKVQTPFNIIFSHGRITEIENSKDGNILKDFIEDYKDDKMYTAGEFGIGLNPLSRCNGNCYIEDESALGTFHIGLGRNLALGGRWEANGHFDLTVHSPDIYADGFKLVHSGKIII